MFYSNLNKYGVSIIDGQNVRKAYNNSVQGRTELESECLPDIVQQVFEVWGDTPTVDEPTLEQPEPVIVSPSTQDIINANVMARLAELEGVANG